MSVQLGAYFIADMLLQSHLDLAKMLTVHHPALAHLLFITIVVVMLC